MGGWDMMQLMQVVANKGIQGIATIETECENEDPEHSLEEPFHNEAQPNTGSFLDSAEFRDAIEDGDFQADLKWACQFTFNRFSQSTHSTWEDLQQEVLIRLGNWLPRYRKEAKRRTVFARIATNVLIDATRSEKSIRRQHEQISFEDLAWEPA